MFNLGIAISRATRLSLGLLGSTLALASGPADAALPPQFERVKEMHAILDDVAVGKAFGLNHPIDKIERVETARYLVSSGPCVMQVDLVSDTTAKHPAGPWYGAWAFTVKAGPLICH